MTDLPPNPKQAYGDLKVPVALVPPAAIIYTGLAFKEGARKYGPYNWREKSVEAMTYVNAAQRHLMSWMDREEMDPDSGNPHLAHALACLAILVDCIETGNLLDNRPPAGNSGALLKRFEKKPVDGTVIATVPAGTVVTPELISKAWAASLQEPDPRWVPEVARPEPAHYDTGAQGPFTPRPLPEKFAHALGDLDQEYPLCECQQPQYCSGLNAAPLCLDGTGRVTCVRFKQKHEWDVVSGDQKHR